MKDYRLRRFPINVLSRRGIIFFKIFFFIHIPDAFERARRFFTTVVGKGAGGGEKKMFFDSTSEKKKRKKNTDVINIVFELRADKRETPRR